MTCYFRYGNLVLKIILFSLIDHKNNRAGRYTISNVSSVILDPEHARNDHVDRDRGSGGAEGLSGKAT